MKYLRLASDIHLDMDVMNWVHGYRRIGREDFKELTNLWFPEPMEGDDDTAFILAGDLWINHNILSKKYPNGRSWLGEVAARFKYVIFVLGNHDYWQANISNHGQKLRKMIADQKLANVIFLDKSTSVLDQVKFTGGTLWTNFNRQNPLVMLDGPRIMNDYKKIRHGHAYHKLRPDVIYQEHVTTLRHIFENSKRDYPEQKVVVVSHHAPSERSTLMGYIDPQDHFYFSDLERNICYEGPEIDFWFHGHMHNRSDYMIDNCRVLCNPRGYAPAHHEQQTNFDPYFRIEI